MLYPRLWWCPIPTMFYLMFILLHMPWWFILYPKDNWFNLPLIKNVFFNPILITYEFHYTDRCCNKFLKLCTCLFVEENWFLKVEICIFSLINNVTLVRVTTIKHSLIQAHHSGNLPVRALTWKHRSQALPLWEIVI